MDVEHGTCEEKMTNAGEKLVLESKGTWLHAGYHLASATAGPPLLSLPLAIAGLGWVGGMCSLVAGAFVSFYASLLLSRVMEHLECLQGKRCLRYRDLATHLLGYNLSMKLVTPLQFTVCFIAIIASILLGGETMKQIYMVAHGVGDLKLYAFIVIFGSLTLILSQLPSLHSLRHLNLLSTLLCIGFSICAVVGSIYAGLSKCAPHRDYSTDEKPIQRMFTIYNALSIMISAYANPLIVEIQATLVPPTKGKMAKGLAFCYTVALLTFFSVGISGYWAFGKDASGIIFENMFSNGHVILVPKTIYVLGNAFACIQLIIIVVLYLQPTFEKLEGLMGDAKQGPYALRNVVPRFMGRSIVVGVATLIASMLPFFAEFSAFIGALGFTPICIILPILFYTIAFKNAGEPLILHAFHALLATLAIVVMFLGTVSSFRQILLNARTYHLFANL